MSLDSSLCGPAPRPPPIGWQCGAVRSARAQAGQCRGAGGDSVLGLACGGAGADWLQWQGLCVEVYAAGREWRRRTEVRPPCWVQAPRGPAPTSGPSAPPLLARGVSRPQSLRGRALRAGPYSRRAEPCACPGARPRYAPPIPCARPSASPFAPRAARPAVEPSLRSPGRPRISAEPSPPSSLRPLLEAGPAAPRPVPFSPPRASSSPPRPARLPPFPTMLCVPLGSPCPRDGLSRSSVGPCSFLKEWLGSGLRPVTQEVRGDGSWSLLALAAMNLWLMGSAFSLCFQGSLTDGV